jgi:hypothetical protein
MTPARDILTPQIQGACVFRQDGHDMVGVADGPGSGLQLGGPTVLRDRIGWIAGGRLPPGATRAVLVGTDGAVVAAAGFWVARPVFEGGRLEPVVRFEDAEGTIVPAPLDTEAAPRQPIADATDPCPACAAMAWAEAVTHPPQVVCEHCGFAQPLGGWYAVAEHPPPRRTPEQAEAQRAGAGPQWAARQAEALARAEVTLWWPEGEPAPAVSGWGGADGRLERISLRAPSGTLHVEVDGGRHQSASREAARDAFADALREQHGRWPDVSPGARRIWLAAREREAVQAAQRAPMRATAVPVARRPCPARVVGDERCWAAVVEPEGRERIIVWARDRGIAGLALAPLDHDDVATPL